MSAGDLIFGSARLGGLLRQPIHLALHQLPIETFVAQENQELKIPNTSQR
jgi:hypothetical protein